ncbi:YdeI family protein [Chloroflexota bacterium]
MTDAGLIKIKEAKNNGFWDNAYTNKDRDEIPEDLNNALLQNKDAWDNFHNFANSYWNMYIGWVNSAKTEQTRKRRIAEVVKRSWLNKKPATEMTCVARFCCHHFPLQVIMVPFLTYSFIPKF